MLQTNLEHIETVDQFNNLVRSGAKVAIVCGRMGPMCVPVYGAMEALRDKYPDVQFCDMDFDTPTGVRTIRSLPEVRGFNGLPFTVYYSGGRVVAATTSIQSKAQIKAIMDSKMV